MLIHNNPLCLHATKRRKWTNVHDAVEQTVARLVDVWNARPNVAPFPAYNATTAALQELIQQALDDDLPTRAYGADRVRAWRDARHTLLPSEELRKAFTNDMLHRLGLDT